MNLNKKKKKIRMLTRHQKIATFIYFELSPSKTHTGFEMTSDPWSF